MIWFPATLVVRVSLPRWNIVQRMENPRASSRQHCSPFLWRDSIACNERIIADLVIIPNKAHWISRYIIVIRDVGILNHQRTCFLWTPRSVSVLNHSKDMWSKNMYNTQVRDYVIPEHDRQTTNTSSHGDCSTTNCRASNFEPQTNYFSQTQHVLRQIMILFCQVRNEFVSNCIEIQRIRFIIHHSELCMYVCMYVCVYVI